MPSGKVHDRITVATAALSLPAWLAASALIHPALPPSAPPLLNWPAYLVGVTAYLFSGFYLSDDLDLPKNVALRRWGLFRFLWWPYQKLIPHRSWVSHGLAVGPLLRVAYFLAALWLLARCLLWLISVWITPLNRDTLLTQAALWLLTLATHHTTIFFACLAGFVLSGAVHTVADTVWSGVKRVW